MSSTIQNSSPVGGLKPFLLKWTPRLCVVTLAGYYGLGVAYEIGLMALIDRVAIRILKHFLGYAGIGAFMPSVQWYGAWGARLTIALFAGLIYDFLERGVLRCAVYTPLRTIQLPMQLRMSS